MISNYRNLFFIILLTFFDDVVLQNSQEPPENGFLKREFSLIKPYSGKLHVCFYLLQDL